MRSEEGRPEGAEHAERTEDAEVASAGRSLASGVSAEDDASDALAERGDVEVPQEAEAMPTGFQVRKHLCDVNRRVRDLQLDHELIAHEDVDSSVAHGVALVDDCNGGLPDEREPARCELQAQGFLVDSLGEAGPEEAMNLDGCADDLSRERIKRPFLVRF